MLRKYFTLIVSLLACNVAFAAKHNTFVYGNVKNLQNPKVYLFKELAFTQTDWPVIDSTMCDRAGNFKLALNLKDALVGAINCSGRAVRIFLTPGDSLRMDIDISDFPKSVTFVGKGGAENNFYLRYRQRHMQPLPQKKMYGAKPAYLLYISDSLFAAAGADFKKAFTDTKANPEFEAFLSQKALYFSATRKLQFPVYQRFVQREDSNEARVDTGYYAFLRTTPFDNPKAYYTDTYADFLYWYFKVRAYEALNTKAFETDESILTKQFDIASAELQGKPLEIAQAAIVSKMFDNNYVTNAGKMIEAMKQRGASTETMQWLDKKYKRFSHLAAGAMAKDFALADTSGKTISLSSLKGKVVYIDFWASWCGPCRKEMPHSRALMEKLKDEPVTFLFVSIDEKPDAWRKAMAQEKLPGIHLLDNRGWSSPILGDYNFHSIPHYVLIDKDGKMVSPDAERPSGGAYAQIKALLDDKKQ